MPKLDAALASVIHEYLVGLDTPRSLTVKVLIDHEEWDQIANLRADPAHYSDPNEYYRAAAATELLRKCQDIDTTVNRTEAAVKSWWQSEKDCCVTNVRLKPFLYNGPFEDPRDLLLADFLQDVRRFITDVLGEIPEHLDGRHGPGATFLDREGLTTVCHKMSSRPSVTRSAKAVAEYVLQGTAWWRARIEDVAKSPSSPGDMNLEPGCLWVQIVDGNRFTTALKDALKHRGISIEASENIFVQLAVGGEMKDRLRRVGLNLAVGKDIHMRKAREASITGRDATLDLTAASDSVARTLVKLLLPEDWYDLLDCLRSHRTFFSGKEKEILQRITGRSLPRGKDGKARSKKRPSDGDTDGEWFYLEKFSSMGNGFTFELETLIFLGLAVVTARRLGVRSEVGTDIYVFGDDIIVPEEVAVPLTKVLRWCGFTLNERKSYITGPFRESCGGDYFLGHDVRPYYLEKFPHDPASWIAMANGIRRVATTDNRSGFERLPVERSWFRALANLPGHIRRLRGPVQLGDSVIHDSPEHWSCYWKGQTRYFKIWKAIQPHIPLKRFSAAVQLASALYGVPPSGPIPRSAVSGYRLGRIAWTILDERNLIEPEPPKYYRGDRARVRGNSLYKSLLLLLSVDR